MPNPIGPDLQVYDPFFGTQRVSDARNSILNFKSPTVDQGAYNRIFHASGGGSIIDALHLTMTIDEDGKMILKDAVAGNKDVRLSVNNMN